MPDESRLWVRSKRQRVSSSSARLLRTAFGRGGQALPVSQNAGFSGVIKSYFCGPRILSSFHAETAHFPQHSLIPRI